MQYTKLDPNDPNPDEIPDEIVRYSMQNQMLRGPLEMFLAGQITYRQALETIVTLLYKEYAAQGKILISYLQENPTYALAIEGVSGKMVKALPKRPLEEVP